MEWLKDQGFGMRGIPQHDRFWQPERDCAVVRKQDRKNPIPSDGLVLIYDDIEYGRSLGQTSKFPKGFHRFQMER